MSRFWRVLYIVIILIFALSGFAAAQDCPKGCECLTEAAAKNMGYTEFCDGKAQICGYEQTLKGEIPKYCYVVPEAPTIVACPAGCECMSPEYAQKYGWIACPNAPDPCGYDASQNLDYCYYEPAPAFVTCPDGCECMSPEYAQKYGWIACPNAPDPCGYDSNQNLEYCYYEPAPAFVTCPDGCECMLPEDAFNLGYVSCPGETGPCGMYQDGIYLYCFGMPEEEATPTPTPTPTTATPTSTPTPTPTSTPIVISTLPTPSPAPVITLPPTLVPVTPTPTPEIAVIVTPLPELVLLLQPTCYDGFQNQDETGIDCGGSHCPPCGRCDLSTIPSRFDWRDYVDLPLIRNQGRCGSCWAFSAVGATEGSYRVEHPSNIDLSEQALVSGCMSGSCNGGWHNNALGYIMNHGVVDEGCLRYQSGNCMYRDPADNRWKCCGASDVAIYGCTQCTCGGYCANPCDCTGCADWDERLWQIGRYKKVSSDRSDIKEALICHGPLAVASDNWNHAVTLVGYDDNNATCQAKYGEDGCWIIRNSWGVFTDWWTKGSTRVWHEDGYAFVPYSDHSYTDLKNRVYYAEGVGRGFEIDYEDNDGLTAGDVNGDGYDEIIHADRSADQIRTYDMDGRLIAEFSRDFQENDGLAAGDVNGDGYDEIIHADRSADQIRVYSMGGSLMSEFPLDFEENDGLAAGDVNGDGYAEIIHGDRGDWIRTYTMWGTLRSEFSLNFEDNDGLAAGDVNGDGIDEIIHGDRSADQIRSYDMAGSLLNGFGVNFEGRDGLAAGDLNNDGTDEIVHADRDDRVHVFDRAGNLLDEFRLDFEGGDWIAVGDLDADGKDEIVHGDREDNIRIFKSFGDLS